MFQTRQRHQGSLVLISLISLTAYAGLVWVDSSYGTLRGEQTPITIGLYILAFLAYLGALIWFESFKLSVAWIWIPAILFRVTLLFTTPTLSDDVYRYIWDGHLANQGVSPYAYPVNSAELDSLTIPQRDLVNNNWMASPYLPLSQLLFSAISALFGPVPLIYQVTMVVIDLISAFIIAKLLAIALMPGKRLLIYLWNPLVIVEIAHGAHVDAWMILLSLLAVMFTFHKSHRSWAAPIFLTFATLTKVLPILLFPILYWHWNWGKRILFVCLMLALLLPFAITDGWGLSGAMEGTGIFGAIRIYGHFWRFNSGIFHWIEFGLLKIHLENAAGFTAAILIGFFIALLLLVWLAARNVREPLSILRLLSIPLMAYIFVTPTFHPWYLLFLLAFLPFLAPSASEPKWRWLLVSPWIYLSGSVIFSYLSYINPAAFKEWELVRLIEWVPAILLTLIALSTLLLHHSKIHGSILHFNEG